MCSFLLWLFLGCTAPLSAFTFTVTCVRASFMCYFLLCIFLGCTDLLSAFTFTVTCVIASFMCSFLLWLFLGCTGPLSAFTFTVTCRRASFMCYFLLLTFVGIFTDRLSFFSFLLFWFTLLVPAHVSDYFSNFSCFDVSVTLISWFTVLCLV